MYVCTRSLVCSPMGLLLALRASLTFWKNPTNPTISCFPIYCLKLKTENQYSFTGNINSADWHRVVRFPNSLGCELGERRSYSLWIELPGPIVQKKIIGSGKMGTELESSTQKLGILISQTFKNSLGSAAERHLSLPPVCHFSFHRFATCL